MTSRLGARLDTALFRLLVRDSFLVSLADVVTKGFVFLVNVMASRTLVDKESYGLFATICIVAQTVFAFASLGLGATAVRAIAAAGADNADRRSTERTMLLLIAVVAAAAALVPVAGAVMISRLLDGAVPADLLRLGGALILVQILAGGMEATARGRKRFRLLPVAAAGAAGIAVVPAYALIAELQVVGGVLALVLFAGLQCLILALALRVEWRGALLAAARVRRFLTGLALPTFLSGAAFTLAMMIPPMILVHGPSGLADVASWNATSQLRVFVTFLPSVAATAAVPHLAERVRAATLGYRGLGTFLALVGVATAVPLLPTMALAAPLMSVDGPEFAADGPLLVLVCSFTAIQLVTTGLSAALIALGTVWGAALVQVVWCLVVLFGAPLVIAGGGAYGLGWLYLYSFPPVTLALGLLVVRGMRQQREGA